MTELTVRLLGLLFSIGLASCAARAPAPVPHDQTESARLVQELVCSPGCHSYQQQSWAAVDAATGAGTHGATISIDYINLFWLTPDWEMPRATPGVTDKRGVVTLRVATDHGAMIKADAPAGWVRSSEPLKFPPPAGVEPDHVFAFRMNR